MSSSVVGSGVVGVFVGDVYVTVGVAAAIFVYSVCSENEVSTHESLCSSEIVSLDAELEKVSMIPHLMWQKKRKPICPSAAAMHRHRNGERLWGLQPPPNFETWGLSPPKDSNRCPKHADVSWHGGIYTLPLYHRRG